MTSAHMNNPDRNLGFILHDAARLLRKRFEQKARGLGLTRSQWQVLAHLARHEGIHQGALAEILELEPITLVRILDRLQAAGLIERRHHATDRRLRLLYLTDEAHPILGQMRAIGAEARSEALAGVSDADRERLIETLLTMRANLTTPATRIEEAVAHG
jgi:MarR family transcriptional regulator, transcriptional regulator for hemolysin